MTDQTPAHRIRAFITKLKNRWLHRRWFRHSSGFEINPVNGCKDWLIEAVT
jgi:hypothetical protein